jgi:hypothetical protein
VEITLDAMREEDARNAVAAGLAFRRIVGADVESDRRATLPPEDGSTPDDVEGEFLEEALLPDADRAAQIWQRVRPETEGWSRMCAGTDASSQITADPSLVDLDRLRWEYVRARHVRKPPVWTPPPITPFGG